ncbi:hypothetical protein KIN20_003910 [Parelaphostrongylus tenuis]|uniref:Uncharacterized protein n=1 Tax=Parelaphostrongylus tenuis TaxID=148309 RepID=A0AAD5M0Y4_PARTN|nr:hypothetical protein KIN20_003910 [Parelaphostrongylus tenuis]
MGGLMFEDLSLLIPQKAGLVNCHCSFGHDSPASSCTDLQKTVKNVVGSQTSLNTMDTLYGLSGLVDGTAGKDEIVSVNAILPPQMASRHPAPANLEPPANSKAMCELKLRPDDCPTQPEH